MPVARSVSEVEVGTGGDLVSVDDAADFCGIDGDDGEEARGGCAGTVIFLVLECKSLFVTSGSKYKRARCTVAATSSGEMKRAFWRVSTACWYSRNAA